MNLLTARGLGPLARRVTTSTLKRRLLTAAPFVNKNFLYMNRIAMACSRGNLSAAMRRFDPAVTRTWEFSAFSQNGEDGILDHLCTFIVHPNEYLVEIGASDGLENSSAYLSLVKHYSGVTFEGDERKATTASRFLQPMNWGVQHLHLFVTLDTVHHVLESSLFPDPDFFSLDIDGIDFYVAARLLASGFRPKIACVEYNSALGPHQALTIPYDPQFDYTSAHLSRLYYGCSLPAWHALFAAHGYEFITVESHGVNAFYVDPAALDMAHLGTLTRLDFRENIAQLARTQMDWTGQKALLTDMDLIQVGETLIDSMGVRTNSRAPAATGRLR